MEEKVKSRSHWLNTVGYDLTSSVNWRRSCNLTRASRRSNLRKHHFTGTSKTHEIMSRRLKAFQRLIPGALTTCGYLWTRMLWRQRSNFSQQVGCHTQEPVIPQSPPTLAIYTPVSTHNRKAGLSGRPLASNIMDIWVKFWFLCL